MLDFGLYHTIGHPRLVISVRSVRSVYMWKKTHCSSISEATSYHKELVLSIKMEPDALYALHNKINLTEELRIEYGILHTNNEIDRSYSRFGTRSVHGRENLELCVDCALPWPPMHGPALEERFILSHNMNLTFASHQSHRIPPTHIP